MSGRVRLFVSNRGSGRVGSGRVNVSPGRVRSKESDQWTTLKVSDVHMYCIPIIHHSIRIRTSIIVSRPSLHHHDS